MDSGLICSCVHPGHKRVAWQFAAFISLLRHIITVRSHRCLGLDSSSEVIANSLWTAKEEVHQLNATHSCFPSESDRNPTYAKCTPDVGSSGRAGTTEAL